MLCRFVSFVTVVHRQPLTDLHPHSPVFRSLLYPCRGCSLRGKQNICAGQAGAAGRSRSAERCEEGQNPPLRALFNQKELTVFRSCKENSEPSSGSIPASKFLQETFVDKTPRSLWLPFTKPFNTPPSRFPRNDYALLPVEPVKIDLVATPRFFFV